MNLYTLFVTSIIINIELVIYLQNRPVYFYNIKLGIIVLVYKLNDNNINTF